MAANGSPAAGQPLGIQGLFTDNKGSAALERAREAGVTLAIVLGRWDEPEPGRYNWDNNVDHISGVARHLRYVKHHGFKIAFTIANVHMEELQMPEYLRGRPFDDPYVLERWELFLKGFLDRFGSYIDYLSIGNEVDWYFSEHKAQFPGYVKFVARASKVVRQAAPHVRLGTVLRWNSLEPWWSQLEPQLDYLGVTYYAPVSMFGRGRETPLDSNSPAYFAAALAHVLETAGRKKVLITELGCASAPEVNSSPEIQAEFIRRFFRWLDNHRSRIIGVIWEGYQDWNYERTKTALEPLLSPELLNNESFMRFLTSLGLRYEDGSPKPGWTAWVEEAREFRARSSRGSGPGSRSLNVGHGRE